MMDAMYAAAHSELAHSYHVFPQGNRTVSRLLKDWTMSSRSNEEHWLALVFDGIHVKLTEKRPNEESSGGTIWISSNDISGALGTMHAYGGTPSSTTSSVAGGSGGGGQIRLDVREMYLFWR